MRLTKSSVFVVLILMCSSLLIPAQPRKALTSPTPVVSGGESTVSEWKLPNGLEVVHIRKPSSKALVSVVTVNVGSKDEAAETSGLSHLLEHMVFDGTARRTRAEINEGSKRYGGYVNATTRTGYTGYLSVFPAEFAELSLDLQADMLFNSTIPAAELEKERRVVIEEMKKDRDSPSTRASEYHDEMLFAGTAYARPVLGSENTIAAVPRATVLNYYHSHYVPSRMKIMITSPFSAPEVRRWMEKYFGNAASSSAAPPAMSRWSFHPAAQPQYREDAVPSVYVHVSFPAPPLGDANYYAYDLLTRYLAEGGSSPLQNVLREQRPPLADSVSADLNSESAFSVWTLSIITQPAQVPAVLDALQRTLQSVAAMGISVEEMAGLQRHVLSEESILSEQAMYYGLTKAALLNAKGYRFVESYPEKLRVVRADDLRRVAEKYFSKPAPFVTALVPQGKIPATEPPVEAQAWRRETLPNGLTLIARGSDESDVFALSIFTRQRSALEPPDEEGISDFVQRMLLKGTASRHSEDIQKVLDSLSAQIQFVDNPFIPYDDAWTNNRWNFFRLEVLDELRGPCLDLMADVVAHAGFPETQVAKVREEILRLQQREGDNASKRADQRLRSILLASTPYARTILGDDASIRKITRENLIEHFHRLYAPSNLLIMAVGKGTTEGVLLDLRSRFESLKGEKTEVAITAPKAAHAFQTEHLTVNKQQTQIAAGTLTAGWFAPDAAALHVLNAILSERLAVELREKQGLAYSVGSELQQERDYGWLEVRLGTRAEAAEEARRGLQVVIRKLAAGDIANDERDRAVNGIWGSTLRQRLSRIGQAFYRGLDELRGPGYDAEDRLLSALRAVTLEDVKRTAEDVLNIDHWVMVSVGKN